MNQCPSMSCRDSRKVPIDRSITDECVAFLTGITGQDGSHLCELLLGKGYQVHALIRKNCFPVPDRTARLLASERLTLHFGDLTDAAGLFRLVEQIQPHEIYNLAAQSHVHVSFDQPTYTAQVNAVGAISLLEAARMLDNGVRFYQASTSEMYGNAAEAPQDETTPFHPRSPYAASKLHAHWQTVNCREAYGLFACCGILFNHPYRSELFVTRKITRAATRIRVGFHERLKLGNLDAKRDWGYAGDYVDAMWRMLQQDRPDDYVIATGQTRSVREFLDEVFGYLDLDWKEHVDQCDEFKRPTEVDLLLGDASKARQRLGWSPTVTFQELAWMMVDADLALAKHEWQNRQDRVPAVAAEDPELIAPRP